MSDAKVRGIVHVIEGTKSYGQKGFRKRVVVIEQNNGRFTNYIPLEFTGDGCDAVEELHVGDDVEVTYRLNGRRWQKDPSSEVKFFLNAEGLNFKVLKGGGGGADVADGDPNEELAGESFGDDDAPF